MWSYLVSYFIDPLRYKISMRYILVKSLQLIFLYALLTVLTEVVVANYLAYQLSALTNSELNYLQVSVSALGELFVKLGAARWEAIWLVDWSLWVFRHRVYYCFLVLAALALYYAYKQKTLEAPHISRRAMLPEHEYAEQKRRTTRDEMAKLKETPAYRDWEKEKGRIKWTPPTPDDVNWSELEQEIYDEEE